MTERDGVYAMGRTGTERARLSQQDRQLARYVRPGGIVTFPGIGPQAAGPRPARSGSSPHSARGRSPNLPYTPGGFPRWN